jgi:hypothetical protein
LLANTAPGASTGTIVQQVRGIIKELNLGPDYSLRQWTGQGTAALGRGFHGGVRHVDHLHVPDSRGAV